LNHLKPHKSVEQIAKKHRLDVSFIAHQLAMGEPIEHEHTKDHKLAMDIALQHLDEIPDYYTRLKKMEASAKKEHKKFKDVTEGNLHIWFQGSKSKNKEPGWVDVVDGDACAREEGETATPKCVSSEKRASMSKEKRLAAQAAKRREDPNQPQKSDASRPTMVKTDRKTRKEEMNLQEVKDKPGKGSGKKDACYTKVKSRYDVWPSAYASGALVKCRKVGAANWGTKSEAAIAISMKKRGIKPKEMKEETGMVRYCPKCQKDETQSECKYGPKFWALYSTPSMLTTNQMKFDVAQVHPANESKEYDHEHSMARSEISTIIGAAKRLKKKIGKGEGNIEAWVQSKITKAADYIDAAADYVDSGEMKKESVNIEDANGNHYAEFIDIIKTQPLKASRGIGSQLVGEGALPSPIDPAAHKQAQKTQKLYNKGTGTDNSNEKEIFLKRTGPQLPLAKTATKKELQVAHYNMKTFGQFMSEAKKSEMKCNSPKSEPVGDSLTGKSHVVKACEGGKEKLIRFGQRGVKGSPKKEGESKEYASRRNRFQTRHAKNIAKGKMSAAYWANKVKW
jgi:hypothetical protein